MYSNFAAIYETWTVLNMYGILKRTKEKNVDLN